MYGKIIPIFKEKGFGVLDPWVLTPQSMIDDTLSLDYGLEKKYAWKRLNRVIGANNKFAIERSDGIFAVLDGTDVDSGTASEIGFGYGLGKKILGYRGDFRLSADNEGSIVNLQVEYFINDSGGKIITELSDLEKEIEIFR